MAQAQEIIIGPQKAPIKTLMVIDDNAVDQMIYRRIIKRSGMVGTVFQYLSALDALARLRKRNGRRIDAILLDINMPRMNGFEFLEAATAEFGVNFTNIVVVMLTTSLDPHDADQSKRFSVVKKYLNKPLIVEHLQQIATYLKHKPEVGEETVIDFLEGKKESER